MSKRREVLSMLAAAGALAAVGQSSAQAKSDLQELKDSKVVRVGAAAAFPFYERAIDGKWQGLVPELMQLIAPVLGVSVQYVDTTWGTAAAGLQSNRFDIMGAFNRTPERAAAVDFTRPIGALHFGLLSLTDRGGELATWASVDKPGRKILSVDGTSSYRTMVKEIKNAQWVLVQNFETLILEIDSGRGDVALASSTEAGKYIQQRKRGFFVVPTPSRLAETNLAIRKSADPQLRETLNAILDDLEKRGELDKVWAKYVPKGMQLIR
jgi:polar amino acid transport system substrate-binding protein